MPSSDSPKSSPYMRRMMWLAAFIVFLVAGWTAFWFWAAGELESRVQAGIATMNADGRVNCENLVVNGYPFRLGLSCSSLVAEKASEGFSMSAGALRTAAQIYAPAHVVGELDGPLRLETPLLQPLDISYGNLRASVRLGLPMPSRISAEIRQVKAALRDGEDILSAEAAEAHARQDKGNLDVSARFEGLVLAEVLSEGRTIPALNGEADGSIADGAAWLAGPRKSLRGLKGDLRALRLSPAPDASVAAAGPWSVDTTGLLDADIQVTLNNPPVLSNILATAFPEDAQQIRDVFAALASMTAPDKPGAVIPLRVIKGEAFFGILPLGVVPPLP